MRVLQVTDCHVLGDPGARVYGVDTYRSLRRVLRAALSLPDPPELVVATGDLVEDGSDASYRRLRGVFLHACLPVYVVAGNHDSLPAMHRSLIGGAIRMQACLDLAAWRIVFLDSTVAGEPYGYLDERELRRLETNLRERTAVPALVCLHHGPIRPCPASGCHLRNDADLLATLGAYSNARVVIAGHAHLEATRWAGHTELLTTPATSLQCAHAQQGELVDHEDFRSSHRFDTSRHGFRMLTLCPDGGFESAVHWLANEHRAARREPAQIPGSA
jgi:Icc protein